MDGINIDSTIVPSTVSSPQSPGLSADWLFWADKVLCAVTVAAAIAISGCERDVLYVGVLARAEGDDPRDRG